jgi:hypothetical protein
MFVTRTEYKKMLTQGYHCILADASKSEIRPNGQIHHCCLTVENPCVIGGQIQNNKIVLDKKEEINFLKQNYRFACPARITLPSPDLIPVCVYYKRVIESIA